MDNAFWGFIKDAPIIDSLGCAPVGGATMKDAAIPPAWYLPLTIDLPNDDINRLESLNVLDRKISSCYFFPRLRQESSKEGGARGGAGGCRRVGCGWSQVLW